jgi:hypothetical protein
VVSKARAFQNDQNWHVLRRKELSHLFLLVFMFKPNFPCNAYAKTGTSLGVGGKGDGASGT